MKEFPDVQEPYSQNMLRLKVAVMWLSQEKLLKILFVLTLGLPRFRSGVIAQSIFTLKVSLRHVYSQSTAAEKVKKVQKRGLQG